MKQMVLGLALAVAGMGAQAVNLLPEGGFERWDAEHDRPVGADWRWGTFHRGTNGFTVCELDRNVKHSGESSLHLKDANSRSLNHSMWYILSEGELRKYAGKILRASAWIKPVSASHPPEVGIALSFSDAQKRRYGAMNGPGLTGPGDWMNVQVKLRVPEDAKLGRFWIHCSSGFGNTAEFYIDDVVISPDVADHPRPTLLRPDKEEAHSYELPVCEDTPEEAAYRKGWREMPPKEEDGLVRPEIRNGTWYVNGHPEYYLGVWLYPRTHIDWNKGANPLNIDHIAYKQPPSKEVFDFMGFNSSQISAARGDIGSIVRGFPLKRKEKPWQRDWKDEEREISEYFPRFEGMPLVMDFAFGYNNSYSAEARKVLDQCKCGHCWHAFVPFCPHRPEGWRYYRDYFLGGTRAALRNGGNIFLYELFNESSWNDMCRYSVVAFAHAMKEKYVTIAAANAAWGTVFDHFADVACQVSLKQFPGVWYDWCQYASRDYCDLLKKGAATIRTADHRSRIYFTEQAAGTPPVHRGMDYRMIADTLDVLAIEGGWQYGFKTVFNAKNEMEAVVAVSGSKHFYNCDFYQALVKGRKPVVNNEHYCTRLENGKRVPSKRTDYITSLWLEVMHGVSANFTYVWDKRVWEANTPEKAYANVVNPSYKSSSLLNPYNVKPEDLCAFKMFQEELEPFKSRILDFPRVKPATVAVLFSKPTEIHRDSLPKPKENVSQWYTTVLHANFPCKVVFEEDLASLGPEVQALVIPGSQSNPASVAVDAKAFQARGGLVVADAAAFAYDEFLKPVPSVEGLVRVESAKDAVAALLAAKVRRYAVIEPVDDPAAPITASDAQVIDRGDFKLVCCVSMNDMKTRRVRLRLDHLQPSTTGSFVLRDPVAKRVIQCGAKDRWTAEDLAAGVPLELPVQERVLLTLEAK